MSAANSLIFDPQDQQETILLANILRKQHRQQFKTTTNVQVYVVHENTN